MPFDSWYEIGIGASFLWLWTAWVFEYKAVVIE